MKILDKLEKSRSFWGLLGILVSFFILRLPSLFEPYWYGDEGVYQAVSMAVQNGRLLYRDIWDNKPPLLYIVYGLLGSDQFAVKLASLIFGLLSVVIFYKVSKKIFLSEKISIISTAFYALLFGLPLIEGNVANAENFMALPILTSTLIILNIKESVEKKTQKKNIFLFFSAGTILGLAFLFKIVAVFDFAAFLIFVALFADDKFLTHLKTKNYKTYEVKKVFSFILGFGIPGGIVALFFLFKGALGDFFAATLFSNIGYVGYGNKFIIPQGLLILKLLLLFSLIAFLFSKRKNFSMTTIFIWLWFAFSLFNAFFSQRPYTHYLLVLLPSLSLLLGLIIAQKKLRLVNLGILIISIILISKNFGVYGKPISYYVNYISFVTGRESVTDYQNFFDHATPIDYELAYFVNSNTNPNDTIFTWGNNAQLYKMTNKLPPGKYTVAYHITGDKNGIKNTERDLAKNKPKIIIIMPYMKFFPFSLVGYSQRIIIDNALVYERTF